MPRPKLQQKKVPLAARVSTEALAYLKKVSKETNRPLSNVVEYLIYLHSNKEIPEPIPYHIGAPIQKQTNPLVNDSIAKISNPDPIIPTEIRRNPYAKED